MNLKFIELLKILQLITIQTSSDSKNIKLQAIKGYSYILEIGFLYLTLETSAHNFVFGPRVHKKNYAAALGPKDCAPPIHRV